MSANAPEAHNAEDWSGLVEPGKSHGLLSLWQHRHLLMLLVRKELRVRYRGSFLGLLWSYVKPGVQFAVYFYALGEFLQLRELLPPFAVYLFAGTVAINLFSETFGNATRAITMNAALVKKIYLPRELFPVSMLLVALVHFVPQVVILSIAAWATGWVGGIVQIGAALAGFFILAILGLGMGMFFGALNVAFRDLENVVDLILMIATWTSPVLYSWIMVKDALQNTSSIGYALYMYNPLTVATELFHVAFWYPQAKLSYDLPVEKYVVPPQLDQMTLVGFGIAILWLVVGQLTFRAVEGRFAQEL